MAKTKNKTKNKTINERKASETNERTTKVILRRFSDRLEIPANFTVFITLHIPLCITVNRHRSIHACTYMCICTSFFSRHKHGLALIECYLPYFDPRKRIAHIIKWGKGRLIARSPSIATLT